MAKKKRTLTFYKKKLDAIYSKYIRRKYSKDGETVKCYTCGTNRPIKTMQCGHFVPRQYLRTRWDERNTHPQCYACNMLYGGQPSAFATNLVRDFGETIIEELERDRMIPIKLDIQWYEEQIETYEKKLASSEED